MKKKICLLIYSLGSGGAERVLSQWSFLLSEKYDVYMTVFDGDIETNYSYYGKLHNLDVKADNRYYLKKILLVLKRAQRLKKFVQSNGIDMVLSFCNEANLVNTLSPHSAKKVCSIRSVSDLDANIFVKYVIMSKHNYLILQTEALKKRLLEQYSTKIKDKLIVFGNPFNTEYIRNRANEKIDERLLEILNNNNTIVNVASLKTVKNHENLLRSFEVVADKIPGTYLILIGADPAGRKGLLLDMASKSKHSNKIVFLGEMENPFPIVKNSSVFVLPSLAEGIPNALAEAMICGVPLIASDCPTGPKELLADENDDIEYNEKGYSISRYGILVKPFKEKADTTYKYTDENYYFANAIIDTLTDNDLYENLRERAKKGSKRFDYEEYRSKLIEMIEEVFNVH